MHGPSRYAWVYLPEGQGGSDFPGVMLGWTVARPRFGTPPCIYFCGISLRRSNDSCNTQGPRDTRLLRLCFMQVWLSLGNVLSTHCLSSQLATEHVRPTFRIGWCRARSPMSDPKLQIRAVASIAEVFIFVVMVLLLYRAALLGCKRVQFVTKSYHISIYLLSSCYMRLYLPVTWEYDIPSSYI